MKIIDRGDFAWDKEIPTVGEPFEQDGEWYIKVDIRTPIVFSEPKKMYSFFCNERQEQTIYAIVPKTPYRFIAMETRLCSIMFAPVTVGKPKEIEVTMNEVEEKFGCKVKIVN